MKITMYELITLIKNKKAPRKIKINEDILNLEKGINTLYKFEKSSASLDFGYYIDNNKLDNEVEILDIEYLNNDLGNKLIKSFLEEEKKIPEKIPEEIIVGKKQPTHRIKKIEKKINEIISYLNYLKSKGE